jgi:hypothetical protein
VANKQYEKMTSRMKKLRQRIARMFKGSEDVSAKQKKMKTKNKYQRMMMADNWMAAVGSGSLAQTMPPLDPDVFSFLPFGDPFVGQEHRQGAAAGIYSGILLF